MMKTYARLEGGRIIEIIAPVLAEEDILGEATTEDARRPILVAAGREIPIAMRFHPDFVATLVAYDPANPPPAPDEPESARVTVTQVSMRQARLALLAEGRLATVNDAIAALPSPQKETAQIEWDYATTVARHSQIVSLLGPALGLDDDALDALFVHAAAL